jgi:hypothetical protein
VHNIGRTMYESGGQDLFKQLSIIFCHSEQQQRTHLPIFLTLHRQF